ncbi:MAG: hypothetical protein WCF57_14825 [Pyrinomonadaceae bacterium]
MPHQKKIKTGVNQQAGVRRRARMFLVLAMVAAIVSGNMLVKVEAAVGDLDPTFSGDGKQRTTFGLRSESAHAVAIQTDGKIVVAGFTFNNMTRSDFAVLRYNTDGTLDTTFSGDGKQTTEVDGNDFAYGVAIQSDGKIVLAGEVGEGGLKGFGLVRYNSDGSLDTTFDGDGKVKTDFGLEAAARGIVIQPNGKIVLGGFTFDPFDFAAARYNTNGSLDTTFSGDGKQITNIGSNTDDGATAIAIQPNGRIVLVGSSTGEGEPPGFAVVRYTTTGALDTTFSGDGVLVTFTGFGSIALAVAIQPNSRIVVGGNTFTGFGESDFILVRYNGNGSLDDGTANDTTPHDMFGTGGIVTTNFFSNNDQVNGLAIQTDGKIVAAGIAAHQNFTNLDYALARYNVDGTLDMTFSGDGKQTTDFGGGNRDEAQAVAIQPDGKIVLAGFLLKNNGDFDITLARYLGD